MVNLKKSFEEKAAAMGDRLLSAVVGFDDRDRKYDDSESKPRDWETWEDAAKKIDYVYDSGFGGADCHAVIAWGEKYVYFVHEYDGATGISCVPRAPMRCAPTWADVQEAS